MYNCPVFQIADLLGKRWAIVVIQEVALNGEKGFNAIYKRMEKVSPKLLSARLKDLEKAKVIEKKIYTGVMPVRTSYSLTERGKELNELLVQMRRWQVKYHPGLLGCERRECVKCPLY